MSLVNSLIVFSLLSISLKNNCRYWEVLFYCIVLLYQYPWQNDICWKYLMCCQKCVIVWISCCLRKYVHQWRVFSILSLGNKKISKFNLILEIVQWDTSTIWINADTQQSLSSLQSQAYLNVEWQTYRCISDGSFGVLDQTGKIKGFLTITVNQSKEEVNFLKPRGHWGLFTRLNIKQRKSENST